MDLALLYKTDVIALKVDPDLKMSSIIRTLIPVKLYLLLNANASPRIFSLSPGSIICFSCGVSFILIIASCKKGIPVLLVNSFPTINTG